MYEDLRGDILAAAGRTSEARTAYQTALTKLDAKSPYHGFVQAKLDSIGGPLGTDSANAAPTNPPQNPPASPATPAPAAPSAGSSAPPK